jgi:hypothetical protein
MGTTAPPLDNPTISKYLTRSIVRQRNSVTLAQWSGFYVALAIPSPASDSWVQQRVVAENIPLNLDQFTQQTMGYFLQDPNTLTDILEFISEDNSTDIEGTLSTENSGICSTFMPRFAAATVTPQQITDWRTQNNSPAAPPASS